MSIDKYLYPNESMLERLTRRIREACFGVGVRVHPDGSCTLRRGFRRTNIPAHQLVMIYQMGDLLNEVKNP